MQLPDSMIMITTSYLYIGAAAVALLGSRPAPDLTARRAELGKTHELLVQTAATDFIGSISNAIAPNGFYGAALKQFGKGPDATRRYLQRDTLNARSRAVINVVRLDVSADGNDGYSYGYLDLIRPAGDTLPGSYKAYWRRDSEGHWHILAFGRAPRDRGPISVLPEALRPTATTYRVWPERDSTEAWGKLQATESAFSDSSATNIRAAFMSFAAPDAGKIDGSGYVFGAEAVGRAFLTPPPGFAGIMWRAELGSVAGSNDLGFNFGSVTRRNAPENAPAAGGAFFTIWRRQPNGEWRYLVD